MAIQPSSFTIQHFFQTKSGNADAEYEDAFWPRRPTRSCEQVRLAVADGAAEASFSREWARLLVGAYGRHGPESLLNAQSLAHLRLRWLRLVTRKELPWFAAQKRESGAFAAIAGLTFRSGGSWDAFALGDCCIFHVRGQKLLRSFPLTRSEQFTTRPRLLSSLDGAAPVDPATAAGDWSAGDAFHLVSDALACWCLAELECGKAPLLLFQFDRSSFAATIQRARAAAKPRQMRNDDVTCVSCAIGATEPERA